MRKKLLLIALSLIAVLALGTAGCQPKEKELTAEQVVEKAMAAADALNSYHSEMDMELKVKGMADAQAVDMAVSYENDIAVDLKNEALRIEATTSIKGEVGRQKMDQATSMTAYVIGDTMYVGQAGVGEKMNWMTIPARGKEIWEQQPMGQVELLKNSRVKLLPSEEVGEVKCYVLELEPDLGMLWERVMQQPLGADMGTMFGDIDFAKLTKNVTVKHWYARNTLLPMKQYVSLEMVVTPGAIGRSGEGEVGMVVKSTALFDKHDQTLGIELPEEAKGSR